MEIPEQIISPFDIEVESTNLDSFLKEFIEMTFNLKMKSMYIFKGIENYRMNKKSRKVSQALSNSCAHPISPSKFVYCKAWV